MFERSRWHVWLLVSVFAMTVFVPQNSFLSAAGDVWPRLESRHFLILDEPTSQPAVMAMHDWDIALTQYVEQLDAKLAPLFSNGTLSQTQTTLGQKPILLICADQASYLKTLAQYGIPSSDAAMAHSGGFYHPASGILFVRRQPTDYYSRHVVLHEVAHWYCLQLLGARYEKMPLWLCEGLADFAAAHTWNGQNLRAMQGPRVSLENYPARLDALLKRLMTETHSNGLQNRQSPDDQLPDDNITAKADDALTPENIARCFVQLRSGANANANTLAYDEYALAWGLTAFLIGEYPGEMSELFDSLSQYDVAKSWQLAFSASQNVPTWPRFADWVAGQQLPWQWVWNHWEDDGQHLIGLSDSTALIAQNPAYLSPAVNKKSADAIAASNISGDVLFDCTVEPLLEGTVIGLVLHYENSGHFDMLQFRNVGQANAAWRQVRFAQKKWEPLSSWQKIAKTTDDKAPEQEKSVRLHGRTSTTNASVIRIFYGDHLIIEQDDERNTNADNPNNTERRSPFALAVQSGAARFLVCP
jgi:hypothetical protein